VVGSALCFAQAAVLVRRFPGLHPVVMNAVGMTAGAALLVAGSVVAGESIVLPRRAATWAALGYLVLVGSVAVFLLYVVVLRHWAASRAAYGFVLIPLVTVGLSVWLDDEPVGAGLVLGGLLVLAGVYVGALRPARVPPAVPLPAEGGLEVVEKLLTSIGCSGTTRRFGVRWGLLGQDRVGELIGHSIHEDLVVSLAVGDDGSPPPADLPKPRLAIGPDGGKVPGEGHQQDVVQPHDREGPIEHEPGGFGAQALVAALADGQAKLGGAGVLVDSDQQCGADRG
jgi:hypothetical protein